ncbi:hypothetical protein B0T17DRAFT_599629 [Bombardia bombarda]|uniref:Uncharacterized protein n=1 Tax=Bombardia bombarda TaxID=252184 RepID=A0AA40C4F7_9PEZI|nr:hypothetical protein B0T17DRAFT_599629 [Bombardia bombarda]
MHTSDSPQMCLADGQRLLLRLQTSKNSLAATAANQKIVELYEERGRRFAPRDMQYLGIAAISAYAAGRCLFVAWLGPNIGPPLSFAGLAHFLHVSAGCLRVTYLGPQEQQRGGGEQGTDFKLFVSMAVVGGLKVSCRTTYQSYRGETGYRIQRHSRDLGDLCRLKVPIACTRLSCDAMGGTA